MNKWGDEVWVTLIIVVGMVLITAIICVCD